MADMADAAHVDHCLCDACMDLPSNACRHCRGKGTLPGNNAPVQGFSPPNCWHCNGAGVTTLDAACPDCVRCWDELGDALMSLLVSDDLAHRWLNRYHDEGHDLDGVRAEFRG